MDLSLITEFIFPIVLIGIFRGSQLYIYKKCKKYFDPEKQKKLKRLLIPAYTETLNIFLSIRQKRKNELTKEDISHFKRSWPDGFDLEKIEDIKDLHHLLEYQITTNGGSPEEIFRSPNDWEMKFNTCNGRFYESYSKIFEIRSKEKSIDSMDSTCWIIFFISIAAFLVTLGINVLSVEF